MAFRRAPTKCHIDLHRYPPPMPPPALLNQTTAVKAASFRDRLSPPNSEDAGGLFGRFLLQRRAINYHSASRISPELLSLPVKEKLRETLRRIDSHSLAPPPLLPQMPLDRGRFSADDARKLLRAMRLEMLKGKLRTLPKSTISHDEFLRICDEVDDDHENGAELARTLDESGNVIVLGNVVFLRPEQVAKSMETLIYQSLAMPNDPRREELDRLEREKAKIDKRAEAQVRTELCCGMGLLMAQTSGFMRLTFWELSWDVMEPICFFVASVHFALAYGFFLCTSTEPSFEGYFRRRFQTKQRKIMEAREFDINRYRELRRAFYPASPGFYRERALGAVI